MRGWGVAVLEASPGGRPHAAGDECHSVVAEDWLSSGAICGTAFRRAIPRKWRLGGDLGRATYATKWVGKPAPGRRFLGSQSKKGYDACIRLGKEPQDPRSGRHEGLSAAIQDTLAGLVLDKSRRHFPWFELISMTAPTTPRKVDAGSKGAAAVHGVRQAQDDMKDFVVPPRRWGGRAHLCPGSGVTGVSPRMSRGHLAYLRFYLLSGGSPDRRS